MVWFQPWKNNYVYSKKKSRIPPEDGLHDFLDVLFYICQIAYNKHHITFLVIKPTNTLFKSWFLYTFEEAIWDQNSKQTLQFSNFILGTCSIETNKVRKSKHRDGDCNAISSQ